MRDTETEVSKPAPAPTGVVTLCFADIVDSTSLSERHGSEFEPARLAVLEILARNTAFHDGYVVSTAGDSVFVAFSRVTDAVLWAIDSQRGLSAHPWPESLGAVQARIGMHTGEAVPAVSNDRVDYFGTTPNRAARLSSAAHGRQILISDATRALLGATLDAAGVGYIDLGRHRLKGLGAERLWQVTSPDLARDFPAPATLSPEIHNLPLAETPFLGRKDEVREIRASLEGKARLVTLSGAGGMGKTRLAHHVAEVSAEDYPGGAWWTEVTEARTAEAMIQKMAFDLGLNLQPPPSARDQLFTYLRSRGRSLLVVDNVEQVEGAEEVLRSLLQECAEVVCLITSRRSLGLRAEALFELKPLPSDDAVQLFTERARAVRADFRPSSENETDILNLCRGLEGIPLAIELAAARAMMMTPRQILSRLSERFRLLQARRSDLPERQRALRATIDWSYELLSEEDRTVFLQLSAFARSGFTLEAAERVCEAFDVLECLQSLRSHSILATELDSATQENRYFLLEALREYAAERIAADSPDIGTAVGERHAHYYLDLAERRLQQLRTPREHDAFADLERIADNLEAARVWAHSRGWLALSVPLSIAIARVFGRRGFQREALDRLSPSLEALGSNGDAVPNRVRAQLLVEHAGLLLDLRENAAIAVKSAEEALKIARQEGDEVTEREALNALGLAAMADRRFPDARGHFTSALSPFGDAKSSPAWTGLVLNNSGLVELHDPAGDKYAAMGFLRDALARRKEAGDLRGIAATLNNIGNVAFAAEDWAAAESAWSDALAIERSIGHRFGVAIALNNLGEAAEALGRPTSAYRFYTAAEQLFSEVRHAHADYSAAKRAALALDGSKLEAADLRGRPLDDICEWACSSVQ